MVSINPFVLEFPKSIEPCHFDKLPLELVVNIVSFLPNMNDAVAFGSTSTDMKVVLSVQSIWRQFHLKLLGSNIDSRCSSQGDWQASFISRMKSLLPKNFGAPGKSYGTTLKPAAAVESRERFRLLFASSLAESEQKRFSPLEHSQVSFRTLEMGFEVQSRDAEAGFRGDASAGPHKTGSKKRARSCPMNPSDADLETATPKRHRVNGAKTPGQTLSKPAGAVLDSGTLALKQFWSDLTDLPIVVAATE